MTERRVVITGVGIISPLALEARTHFKRLLDGKSAVETLSEPQFRNSHYHLQARVHGFDKRKLISHRMLRKLLSPSSTFAVVAAGQALADAGFESNNGALGNCGLYVGSVLVDIDPELFISALKGSRDQSGELDITQFATRGMYLIDPLFLVKALPNAGLCGITIQHQVLGPNLNITNGTVSALQAVITTKRAIERGEIEMALAGGYDSLVRMDTIIENLIANRLSKRKEDPEHACRPFDARRDGHALSEGAAFVLLESEEHARNRGARIYAELLGAAQTTDSSRLIKRGASEGLALEYTARKALSEARCEAAELGVIFGDGMATVEDDLAEAAAARRLVGDGPTRFTAATGSLGFAGAASSAFSLIHALLGMRDAVVPPMINCDDPDPLCKLKFAHKPEPLSYRRAMVWNSDRGIKNVALVLGSAPEG